MKRRSRSTIAFIALIVLLEIAGVSTAQDVPSSRRPLLITGTRVTPHDASVGRLYITIRGREKKIANEAIDAWIIRGGRQVVYSGMDGSGGFENEGQSLRIYDPRTRKRHKILSEYYGVDEVTEVSTSLKKTGLLVKMSDGGLGANYLAVVDPDRGEVFFRRWARMIERAGDFIVIGYYKEEDSDALNSDRNAKITPYKTERHSLIKILARRVIVNKKDRP